MTYEIQDRSALVAHLNSGAGWSGVRLQGIDLTGEVADRLMQLKGPLNGLVVLGGTVPPDLACHLSQAGAIIFPPVPTAPVNPYRSGLYSAKELYGELSRGYEHTLDARAYAWLQDRGIAADAYTTALRALHDDSIRDALTEVLDGCRGIGIMGGHAMARDTENYRHIARLAKHLADDGFTVLTGGGPGAMEAANLGAADRTGHVEEALDLVARCPSFRPDITPWARRGFEAKTLLTPDAPVTAPTTPSPEVSPAPRPRSIGIPTWFYGHEPPNVFPDAIAKYFSNALREDDLLSGAREAVIVLEGAAGTVQEIFQSVTPLYYAPDDAALPDLILVGVDQWRREIPVWDALRALAAGRPMAAHLHLVDGVEEARDLVQNGRRTS